MSSRRTPGSIVEDAPPDFDDELEEEFFDNEESGPVTTEPTLAEEPLFSWLLRQAVFKTSPDDIVLQDYVTHVAPALSEHLALKTAKGGEDFVAQRLAEGKSEAEVARYRKDQSLRAHLVNGLLPVTHIARLLHAWEAPRFFAWNEELYRLFCTGFTLHDWVKLPEMEAELAARGLRHDKANPALHLPAFEEIFRQWGIQLGLDSFLEPIGGLEGWLHDVIYLAVNTQRRWGTMLNLSALPKVKLNGRSRELAVDLCTLADRLAYIAKTPVALTAHPSITEPIYNLSGGGAQLLYHHVSENRGVLTNFIHNAAMSVLQNEACVPLLYAPSGVVYLARLPAPQFPDVTEVAEANIQRIREACGKRLMTQFVGFSRAGKGLKAAPYYDLHLSIPDQIRLTARAVFKQIPETKKAVFAKRLEKIDDKGWLDAPLSLDELDSNDIRVDQLAEFAAYVVNLAQTAVADFDASHHLLNSLNISAIQLTFAALQSAPNTGGTPYHWYYAAAYYTQHTGRGKDPAEWRTLLESLAESLAQAVENDQSQRQAGEQPDGWDDLRRYIAQTLTFGPTEAAANGVADLVTAELLRYQGAKRKGRQATAVCSLCSSAFTITPQREAGILFSPQVYTNKQPLHGTKAIRNICQLCETEMMLRQILMNRGGSIGGRFEGRKFRYLYFYPAYFFTPETAAQVSYLYHTLKTLSFSSIRKALLNEVKDQIQLDIATLQRLQAFLLTPEPPEEDRLFRLHFPENDPISLFFVGIPPGRDAKDAEAWINPAFLALLLPLVLDVKVVATESPIPLLHEADELDETIFFDAPHHYVNDIVGYGRLPLDRLLTRLRGLIVAYMIHLDGNAQLNKGDYRWHAIPPLARNLASNSLWASAYLKKWQRAQSLDAIPTNQAKLYQQYIEILDDLFIHQGGVRMSHARQLTELYRQFYRHKRRNSNSILRPITVASRAILDADPRLFGDKESLTEVVYGEVRGFMDRVANGSADGRLSPRLNDETPGDAMKRRFAAVKAFTDYFVGTIYFDVLGGDMAALRGKQLNLLKNSCEVIYLDAESAYWQDRNAAPEEADEDNQES
jgi:CRISPR-associated protein Csc3